MRDNTEPLALFHPIIQKWFTERIGQPTDIQLKAWPVISSDSHVLITAPTGSGKTLTAFLWALNQLITGVWSTGNVRVLYISPLKALNNDIQRNLLGPIEELKEYFAQAGEEFPDIRVLTRSGDTPQEDRRRMLRHAPEILITTPESLNILLSSKNNRALLTGISTVILDEVHTLVASKRGTHLITAVERVTRLSGEFQRITLSATVKPLEVTADFIAGYEQTGDPSYPAYKKRKVSIIKSSETKNYDIKVTFPQDIREKIVDDSIWPGLTEEFKKIIVDNRSTLLFANSRRLTEKITRFINENEPEELAYSHHGSLSKEIRMVVEDKLKRGELKAIVATNSLELGIDIGDLDQVVLIQTPPSISSAIQRIGRSGHRVGESSRGLLFPTYGRDFLNAAVTARSVIEQEIEGLMPIDAPLDILAQIIISMTVVEEWDINTLYSFLKQSYPYHKLNRKHFDLVLDMLAGRYADTRLRELKPRISIDRIDNRIKAKDGVQYLLFLSGGTIPDRGQYDMRLKDSRAKIGELDEEFVWERSVGETFSFGAQIWRIVRITHNDVEVSQAESKPGIFPFWRGEEMNRDFFFSEKISNFLEYADSNLDDPGFIKTLQESCCMEENAALELFNFLLRQKEHTKTNLPHRNHLLIEHFEDPMNQSDSKQVILHTIWGGKINRPFALALSAAWEQRFHYRLETIVSNDSILLMLPHDFKPVDIFTMVAHENIGTLLHLKLESTGFFGALFRENAGRALLLPKASFKKRLPLWLNRLRSKKLMDSVMHYENFPILVETWRTCLKDEFDLENLKLLLDEIQCGRIQISETITKIPSPFADDIIWKQTNKYMYEDDSSESAKKSALDQSLLKELANVSELRSLISEELIAELNGKMQRTASGYAPTSSEDLLDWTKERLLIPLDEWKQLLNAVERDVKIDYEETILPISDKLIFLTLPGAILQSVCAIENLPIIASAFQLNRESLELHPIVHQEDAPADKLALSLDKAFYELHSDTDEVSEDRLSLFLEQWLSFYGTLTISRVKDVIGLKEAVFYDMIETMSQTQVILFDKPSDKKKHYEICHRDNFEILLRMARKARQPQFKALGIEYLPLFIASFQGLTKTGEDISALQDVLDQLFGYPAPAGAWEEFILPARLNPYYPAWLDSLMQSSELIWFGCGTKKTGFAFIEDLELFKKNDIKANDETDNESSEANKIYSVISESKGKYTFFDIIQQTGLNSEVVTKKLWEAAWQGRITNDSFAVLRKAILNRFRPFKIEERTPRRSNLSRWSSSRPIHGNWFELVSYGGEMDAFQNEELVRDRIRQLLGRYGVLFRELLEREQSLLRWANIFRSLRIMELSGELITGHFFQGIPGLQFMSHEGFRFLTNSIDENAVYWLNATDPASICGIRLEELKSALPSRVPSTTLVYRGTTLVLVSRRNGKTLEINASLNDNRLYEYLSFFRILLNREFNPMKAVFVETINGEHAAKSEYSKAFKEFGFFVNYNGLELRKRY